eukprot:955715-Pleurochrysis_carterae.AAC.1
MFLAGSPALHSFAERPRAAAARDLVFLSPSGLRSPRPPPRLYATRPAKDRRLISGARSQRCAYDVGSAWVGSLTGLRAASKPATDRRRNVDARSRLGLFPWECGAAQKHACVGSPCVRGGAMLPRQIVVG